MNKALTETQIEWLDWDAAMRVVRTARVGSAPWRTLADWCGEGLVDTVAGTVTCGGQVTRDTELAPSVWRASNGRGGAYVDPMSGAVKWAYREEDGGPPIPVNVMGPRFRKDQLLSLVSHIDEQAIQDALAQKGDWLNLDRQAPVDATSGEMPEVATGKRGRKPDKARWTAFWFAAVELAREGRLQRGGFSSAAELGEELLAMMGDGAFSPDHIKAEVGQLYRRFVGD